MATTEQQFHLMMAIEAETCTVKYIIRDEEPLKCEF
jgi:hypothetical protein